MNSELCYVQGGIKTVLCIFSVMLLCRYIKRTRLCNENFRDKFYIFNTYFFGKLEEALYQPVRSFFVMHEVILLLPNVMHYVFVQNWDDYTILGT